MSSVNEANAPYGGMVITIEDIDPQKAIEMLTHNTRNRKLRPSLVTRFGRDMTNGKWIANAEPFIFDVDGALINGQHRLEAIVATTTTLHDCVVVRNAPRESMNTIDQGMQRSMGDVLKLNGYVNQQQLAAGAGLARRWEESMGSLAATAALVPTRTELLEWINERPELVDCVRYALPLVKSCRVQPSVAVAFVYAAMKVTDPDVVWSFLDDVSTGVALRTTDPAFRLRKYLLDNAFKPKRRSTVTQEAVLVAFVRAFNAYLDGVSMQQLNTKLASSGAFPDLEGPKGRFILGFGFKKWSRRPLRFREEKSA